MFKHQVLLSLLLITLVTNYALAEDSVPGVATTASVVAWVDVRSWVEYQVDHIDGDERIGHQEIVGGVSQLYPDKNTPIRLYCRSGGRAGTASQSLLEAGYTNVENVGSIDQARALRAIPLSQ